MSVILIKQNRAVSKYTISVLGEVFECSTGRFLFEISPDEAWLRRKMGGPRLDRWVESKLEQ